MLTRQDLRWNYMVLNLASKLNIFPVSFDRVTGRMRIQRSKYRKILFRVWVALGFAHSFYLTMKTVQAGVFSKTSYGDFFPMMVMLSFGILCTTLFAHLLFISRPGENVKVYNEILGIRGTYTKFFLTFQILTFET